MQDDAEAEAVPEGLDPAVFNSSEAVAARARVLELTRAGACRKGGKKRLAERITMLRGALPYRVT